MNKPSSVGCFGANLYMNFFLRGTAHTTVLYMLKDFQTAPSPDREGWDGVI